MEFGGFSLTFPLHLISVFKEVALANYLPLLSFALSIMSQEIKVLAHFPSHCSRKQWFFWSRSYWCFVGTGQAPEEGVRLCGIPCLPGLSDFDLHPLWSSSLSQNCSSTVESGSKLLRAAPDSHTYLSLERSAILLQRLYPICTIKIFQSKGFPTHSHPHWLLCLSLSVTLEENCPLNLNSTPFYSWLNDSSLASSHFSPGPWNHVEIKTWTLFFVIKPRGRW